MFKPALGFLGGILTGVLAAAFLVTNVATSMSSVARASGLGGCDSMTA